MRVNVIGCSVLSCLLREVRAQFTVVESIGLCPTDPGFSTTLYETRTGSEGPVPSVTGGISLPGGSITGGSTVTGSSVSSSASPSSTGSNTAPSTIPNEFLIALVPSNRNSRRMLVSRADNGVFVAPDGSTSEDCRTSIRYSVSDAGILSAAGYGLFSTSDNVPSQKFVPSTTIQDIYAVWVLNAQGNLEWTNGLFLGGKAALTLQANGSVEVYFTVAPPSTEIALSLSIREISSCPGYGESPSSAPTDSAPSSGATSPPVNNPSSSPSPTNSQSVPTSSPPITPPNPGSSSSLSYGVPGNSSFYFPTSGGGGSGVAVPTVSGLVVKRGAGWY